MAHYHKARGQQKKKWERFQGRFGMTPAEWRLLKKTDPKKAHEVRVKAYATFIRTLPVVKLSEVSR